MPRDQLRESIQHLQDELSSGEPLSSEERARLEAVLGQVSQILAPDDIAPSEESDEETHPNLAVVLGRIASALSQLGI